MMVKPLMVMGCLLGHENNSTPQGRLNSGSVAGKERGIVFTGNTVLPRDGRGVILNGWNNAFIADNTILSWEKPNNEFGDNLNAPAIRIRYQADNITVRNNTTLGVAGEIGVPLLQST